MGTSTRGLFHLILEGSAAWYSATVVFKLSTPTHTYVYTYIRFKIRTEQVLKTYQRSLEEMQPVPAHKKGIYRTAHLFSTYLSLCSHLKGMMKSENWPRCQENGSRGLKLKIFPVGNLNKQRKQIHLLFYFCSLDSWKPLIPLNSQPSSESSTQTWLHKIWNVLHTEEKHGGKKK